MKLKTERPGEDHGNLCDDAYTKHAVPAVGKHLLYMDKKFKCGPDNRTRRIVWSQKPALIIIDRRPGQQRVPDTALRLDNVATKPLFIESDNYMYFANNERELSSYFERSTLLSIFLVRMQRK